MIKTIRSRHNHSGVEHDWLFRITAGMACISSVWLMGIPPLASVLVTGILGVLIAFGRTACNSVGLKEVGIGVGLVVGSGFLVLAGQFLLMLGTPEVFAHWTIIAGMASFTMIRQRVHQVPHFLPRSTTYQEVFSCLAIALLVLAVRHPWLLFFAIPIVALERYVSREASPNRYWTLLTLICGFGLVLSKQFQPINWWYYYQGNDAQFFEAVGFTLAKWGVFEHPGSPGFSFANYHWLTYAFFGQITRLASLDTWDALLKVGPLLIPFTTAGVLASRSRKLNHNLFVLILLGSLGLSLRETDSLAFSIPIGFAALFIVERFISEKVKYRVANILFLFLVFVALIFAKITTAVVVLAVLALWFLSDFRTSGIRKYVPLVMLGFTCALIYLLLFRQQTDTPTFDIDFQFAHERLTSRFADQRYGLQILTCVAAIAPNFLFGRNKRELRIFVYAAATATIGSICIATFVTGLQIHYWFLTGSYIAVYYAISYAQIKPNEASLNEAPRIWIIAALLLGVLTARFWDQILHVVYQFLSQSIGPSQWDIVQSNGLIFISIAICIVLSILTQKRSRPFNLGVVLVLTLVFGFVLEFGRQNYLSLDVHRYGISVLENPSGGNNAPFAGSDLQRVARFIRAATSDETILASNNFCCEGDEWWPYARISTGHGGSQVEVGLEQEWSGGANYLLPAYTRRRFLMQGLGFQIATSPLTSEQIVHMNLSLEFANSPNMQTVQDLKANGVSGFVVNLSLTERRDWSEFATERIRSGNFVYLEFR